MQLEKGGVRDMTDIQVYEENGVYATKQTTEQSMISLIANLAKDPGTDIDKIERLLEVQIKMMERQAKIEFDGAFLRLQIKMPRIKENGKITNTAGKTTSTYLKYEDIDKVIRPLLHEEGFALMHDRRDQNGKMVVRTILRHRGGHQEAVENPLPYDTTNALKNAVQCAVSTFSYGKRINVCSLLNIVAEGDDNDGALSGANYISESQVEQINSRLHALYEMGADVDVKRLLSFLGVDSFNKLPCSKFDLALKTIKTKEEKEAKK